MKIGLALPHYDFSFPDHRRASVADVAEYARRAESLGFDSVWVSDHLFLDVEKYGGAPGRHATPECLAMCAAIAERTARVRFGPLVLCAPFRHAAVLAASVRALAEMSNGRFECGLGAGWYEPEFVAAGIPFGTTGTRMENLRAASARVRADVPDVPVLVGGKGGPKLARIVAENASAWNVSWRMTPPELSKRLDVLRAACEAAGRTEPVRVSVGLYALVGEDLRDLARRFDAMRAWTPGIAGAGSLPEFGRGGLVGTPDECAATVKEFEALGVDEIVVSAASLPFSVYDDEQLELIARELIPRVR
jgi:alkanesulfonate monooxygenase SsuD/methylene tetrahydromethanopterin reductase-like flavin-dependent oxidoreductase (luciferase family)